MNDAQDSKPPKDHLGEKVSFSLNLELSTPPTSPLPPSTIENTAKEIVKHVICVSQKNEGDISCNNDLCNNAKISSEECKILSNLDGSNTTALDGPVDLKPNGADDETDEHDQDSQSEGNGGRMQKSCPFSQNVENENANKTLCADLKGASVVLNAEQSVVEKTLFSTSDTINFLNRFLETVAELRIKRAVDTENEDKIRSLVSEKHHLENKFDEAQSKNRILQDELEEKVAFTRKQYEERLKQYGEDKAKLKSNLETGEKEVKSLKDEVRALQLTKYTLEKKLQELERKVQLHSNSKSTHLDQITELETTTCSFKKQLCQLTEQQNRLKQNVKEAGRLNKKLMYVNEHQKCEAVSLQQEVHQLQAQIIQMKVQLDSSPTNHHIEITKARQEIDRLSLLVKSNEELGKSLQEQLQCHKEEKQKNLESLKASHELIEHQVQSSNRFSEEAIQYRDELEELRMKHTDLTNQHNRLSKQVEEEKQDFQQQLLESKDKENSLSVRLETLQSDHEHLGKLHTDLEDLNTTWAKKNVELAQQVQTLQEQLDRPKQDVEVQTHLDTEEIESQTEQLQMKVQQIQTDVIVACLKETQTTDTVCVDSSTQTKKYAEKTLVSVGTSTDNTEPAVVPCSPQLCSSQPIISQTSKPCSPELPSSQPLPSQDLKIPIQRKTEKNGSGQHESVGDAELSPFSRFTASLKAFAGPPKVTSVNSSISTTIDSSHSVGSKLKRRLHRSESASAGAEDSTCSNSTGHYAFQFLSLPGSEPKDTNHSENEKLQEKENAVKTLTGILQEPGVSKSKKSKRVHFAKNFQNKGNGDGLPLSDSHLTELNTMEGEESLFSDEETDRIELGSQVSRIENFLQTQPSPSNSK